MNARHLANLLLEMNILNTKDVDRELNRIVARVYDKRAKEWMLRVGRYFLLNINELMDKEAKLRPEFNPRNPWYFHPEQGWIETERMRKPPPPQGEPTSPDTQWVYQSTAEPSSFAHAVGDGMQWSTIESATIFPAPDPAAVEALEGGQWVRTVDIQGLRRPSAATRARTGNLYTIKRGEDYLGSFENGIAGWVSGEMDTAHVFKTHALKVSDKEAEDIVQQLKQLNPGEEYKIVRVPERMRESRSVSMADFILEVRDKKRPTYSTVLHTRPTYTPEDPRWGDLGEPKKEEPFWKRAREQAFKQFDPKKAKKEVLPGEGIAKSDVQDWMFDPSGKPKDLQYFNPWETDQQEVWQVLNDIADWFNYVDSQVKAGKNDDEVVYQKASNPRLFLADDGSWKDILSAVHYEKDDAQEAQVPPGGIWVNPAVEKAKEAERYLDSLKSHKKNDVDAFRDVVMDAHEFKHDVQHNTSRFVKDVKTVSRQGNISIRRTTTFEGTKAVQNRPGYQRSNKKMRPSAKAGNEPAWPDWCVHTSNHYFGTGQYNYSASPLYFVEKEGKPYVLVHWPSGQVKIEDNTSAPAEVINEIAPAFAANRREFPDAMMQATAGGSSRFGGGTEASTLAKKVLELRRGS